MTLKIPCRYERGNFANISQEEGDDQQEKNSLQLCRSKN